MIIGACPAVPHVGRNSATQPGKQGPARSSGSREPGIDVDVEELVNRLRAHVRGADHPVGRQLALNGKVPGPDASAMNLTSPRAPGTHIYSFGQIDNAGADVGHGHLRNTLIDRIEERIRIRDPVGAYGCGVETSQRAREGQWIVSDSIAASDHCVVIQAVGKAYARAEQFLAGGDADASRNIADAAQEDLIGLRIPALDAAITARDERVVLVAQTDVQRQLSADLPPIAEI